VTSRQDRLLKGFDSRAPGFRRALAQVVGDEPAEEVAREARRGFEGLAKEIPYADREKDPMVRNIVGPAQILAYVLPLKHRGASRAEVGTFIRLSFQPTADRAGRLPKPLVRVLARLGLPFLLRSFRKQAAASQARDDPNEFVYEIVEEPGSAVAMNMTRCAVCTLFERHDAMDVLPYVCAVDDQLSDAMGLGLRRTSTRALGADRCDFRYQPGGAPRRLRDHHDLPLLGD
jgi:hypothetical protein